MEQDSIPEAPTTRARDRDAEFSEICAAIAAGESVSAVMREFGHAPRTFWKWLFADASLVPRYQAALAARAEVHAEEIAAIADADPSTLEVRDKDGNVVEVKIDAAFEAWRKTRIDARKWSASRLLPKRYGDKLELDAKVAVGDAVIERLARARSGTKE